MLEGCCYVGLALSFLIARNIYRMENKSFLSKMFLAYFAVDFVVGLIEKYFHFVVINERYTSNTTILLMMITAIKDKDKL